MDLNMLESREITEIRTTAHRYLHKKVAQNCCIWNVTIQTKSSISVSDHPEDDTGCPHTILNILF
jgi:Zn-dependent M16 (insulinase) family peptidase